MALDAERLAAEVGSLLFTRLSRRHFAARLDPGAWDHVLLRLVLIVLAFSPVVGLAQDCAPDTVKAELLQRNEADQAARKALLSDPQSEEALERVLGIDRENTKYMRALVTECGWPMRS